MNRSGNVFKGKFLKAFRRRDESYSSSEALHSGRWKIVETEGSFDLFQEWADEASDRPFATFRSRDHALLFAGLAAALAQTPVYEGSYKESCVLVNCDGREVGKLLSGDDEVLDVLNVGGYLVRNPSALAYLLEAAGPSVMEAVGRLLYQRTEREFREGDANGSHSALVPSRERRAR